MEESKKELITDTLNSGEVMFGRFNSVYVPSLLLSFHSAHSHQ